MLSAVTFLAFHLTGKDGLLKIPVDRQPFRRFTVTLQTIIVLIRRSHFERFVERPREVLVHVDRPGYLRFDSTVYPIRGMALVALVRGYVLVLIMDRSEARTAGVLEIVDVFLHRQMAGSAEFNLLSPLKDEYRAHHACDCGKNAHSCDQ